MIKVNVRKGVGFNSILSVFCFNSCKPIITRNFPTTTTITPISLSNRSIPLIFPGKKSGTVVIDGVVYGRLMKYGKKPVVQPLGGMSSSNGDAISFKDLTFVNGDRPFKFDVQNCLSREDTILQHIAKKVPLTVQQKAKILKILRQHSVSNQDSIPIQAVMAETKLKETDYIPSELPPLDNLVVGGEIADIPSLPLDSQRPWQPSGRKDPTFLELHKDELTSLASIAGIVTFIYKTFW